MATKAGPNIITDGLVLNIDPANVKSYPVKTDPYANSVTLMLDGESLTDKSVKAQPFTNNNNVIVSENQKKFGTSSLYFSGRTADGGSNSYLSFAANSDFGFGSGNWTVETWFYKTTPLSSLDVLFDNRIGAGGNVYGMALYIQAGVVKAGNDAPRLTGATVATGVWNHLMISRSGNNIYLGVNGTVVTAAFSTTLHSAPQLYIGNSVIGEYAGGYMDDYLIIKGFCKYTANFTPPTAPLSLPGRITDTKGKSVGTLTNGPVFSNVQNGAISFDGAGDYLDFPSSESFNFSSNNFCIESWIYLNQYPVNNNGYYSSMIICKDQISNRSWDFLVTGTSSANTTLQFTGFINNSSIQQANISYAFNLNTWYHVACSRVGNYIYLYVNGICINPGGTSFTATIQNTSSVVRIGAQVYSTYYYYFNGSIANLKVYKDRGLSASEVEKNYTATRKRFVETPKTIPGLQLWLDGADLGTMRQNSNGTTAVAVNGDPVGYWGDKSGNGRHAIQATSNSRPLIYSNQNNGLPALQFDGSDDWLYTNTSGTVGTIINVYYHTNSGWSLYDGVFSIRTNTYLLNASSFCYSLGAPSNNYSTKISLHASPGNGNGVACDDLPSPADSRINGQTAQSAFNYYTQGQTVSQLWNIVDSRFVPVSGTYNIGFGADICCAGRYSPMKYAECLIYDRYLSDSELKTIYGYLNQKWAIF